MEPITAAVTITQAAVYCSTLASSLLDLYNAIKNGRQIFQEHHSSIGLLLLVIKQLLESWDITRRHNLKCVLQSIEQSVQRLLRFFNKSTRLSIILLYSARRTAINEAFASLERQKTTLLVYLVTENSSLTASTLESEFHYSGLKTSRMSLVSETQSFLTDSYVATNVHSRTKVVGYAGFS